MKHALTELYAEQGPLLVFDAESERRWNTRTFNDFVLNDGERPEAEAGHCVWLQCDGIRQFIGSVELLVEEPTPEHVQYAHQHAENLWLRVPSGKLVLTGRAAVLADAQSAGDAPRHEFNVPPGDYAADVWAYEPHELRLEDADLPGDPPQPKWSVLVSVATWSAALVTLAGLVAMVSFFMLREWPLFGVSLTAIVAAWVMVFIVNRATGYSRYITELTANMNRAIAALPPIPDFTVRLRRVDVPPPSGGGVSNARG